MQDEASQLVALLAGDRPGARVLDTCASPGGKTTAIAARDGGRGLLVACDVRERRIDLLRRTVAASGAANVRIVQADLLRPLPFRAASTACSSTRRAPGSARCGAIPTSAGGGARHDLAVAGRRAADDAAARRATRSRRADGWSTRPARASRRRTKRSSTRSSPTTPDFAPRRTRRERRALAAGASSIARGHLRTQPHLHGLEAFFGAVFERQP